MSTILNQMLSAVIGRSLGSNLHGNSININVRYNGRDLCLNVNRNCTIADLKKQIMKETGSIGDVSLILGGEVLTDHVGLQECGVQDQTMIHAFRHRYDHLMSRVPSKFLCQYFVFCKDCQGVVPGKLRVKCSTCKEGAFIADRGPDGWHDITEVNRISGICQNNGCHGNTAEFYFKCGVPHGISSTTVGLRHIRPNTRNIECMACGEIQTPVLVYPCEDGHVTCLECFKQYCKVRLNERMFIYNEEYGYTLPCPAQCENSLIKENHHFCLMGESEYDRYKDFGAEELVLRSGGVLCPGRYCGNPCFPDSTDSLQSVMCPVCLYVFCANCHSEAHEGECQSIMIVSDTPQDYPLDITKTLRGRWEYSQSVSKIKEITKPCPKCKTPTEKNGGCSHMKCTRCNIEWCWLCELPWNTECQGNHWFD